MSIATFSSGGQGLLTRRAGRERGRRPWIARTVSLALAVLAVQAVMLASSAPAKAAVWGCGAYINTTVNAAVAYCDYGFGSVRVAATCNSPSWPYTTTVYGAWVYRYSGGPRVYSVKYADSSGCHVTKAWYQVR